MMRIRFKLASALIAVIIANSYASDCHDLVEHDTYNSQYQEFTVGDPFSRLILTSTHGGSEKPDDIPDRTDGCLRNDGTCDFSHGCGTVDEENCNAMTLKDLNTLELTLDLAKALKETVGKNPHVIVNNLHRIKMDANREVNEATLNVPGAVTAHTEFHDYIEQAKCLVKSSYPDGGLLVDIHGMTQADNIVQLGYTIQKADYESGSLDNVNSSMYHLSTQSDFSMDEIIRGPVSLGAFLEAQGQSTFPSPAHPTRGEGRLYAGGYVTTTHGSRDGGVVDAVQVEIPSPYRQDYTEFVPRLARALEEFISLHYDKKSTNHNDGKTTNQNEALVDMTHSNEVQSEGSLNNTVTDTWINEGGMRNNYMMLSSMNWLILIMTSLFVCHVMVTRA